MRHLYESPRDLGHILAPLDVNALGSTDTATLKAHLAQSLTLTAQALAYVAAIWRELEARGEDLSDLQSGLMMYLPLIASGRLDANLVVKYAGQRMLVMAIARLPLPKQRELAERGTVAAVVWDGDEKRIQEAWPLHRIGSQDIRFIFSETGVRPPSEQWAMRERQNRRAQTPRPKRAARVVSVEDDYLLIGEERAKIATVVRALESFYGFDVETVLERERNSRRALESFKGPQP